MFNKIGSLKLILINLLIEIHIFDDLIIRCCDIKIISWGFLYVNSKLRPEPEEKKLCDISNDWHLMCFTGFIESAIKMI